MRMRLAGRLLVNPGRRHYGEDLKRIVKDFLKESPVPTSRTERLFRLGGLAAGLGLGVAGEALRRLTGAGPVSSLLMNRDNVERIVSTLTRMRGAALKLGQMMSLQDNIALPAEAEAILAKVRDAANFMPKWQMEEVMQQESGPEWRLKFGYFEEEPFAAASIGQVHRATLQNGTQVVVKVQYPGVKESIVSDLENLKSLLLISQLLPKGLYLDNTIRVAQRELIWETDYEREAQYMRQFREWLKDDARYLIPDVHMATKRVLVTDYCPGVPVNSLEHAPQEERDAIVTSILDLTLKELFQYRCMQTDPNWSNYLYSADKRIILLDFGATREFSESFVSDYGMLLRAAVSNDTTAVEDLSVKLGFLTGLEAPAMRDAHLQATLTLALPFQSDLYDFGEASGQVIQRIRSLIPTMINYRLTPPPDESYSLHRKLSGVFLLATKLKARVHCRLPTQ